MALRPALVLGYHSLGNLPREQDPANLMVAPDRFRDQLEALRRRGYSFVRLLDFVDRLGGGRAPEGLCAVTFDDGGLDNLTVLMPMLERLRVPATVFACPGLLGDPHPYLAAEAGVRLMDADELRRLAASPWVEIGSHTSRHTELVDADGETAYRLMAESRRELEGLLDEEVLAFAYPNCTYSPHCPEATARAGYAVAVTCGLRGSWTPYELRREAIDGLDRGITYELKVRGVWRALYDSPPGRLARRAIRPVRHRSARAQAPTSP